MNFSHFFVPLLFVFSIWHYGTFKSDTLMCWVPQSEHERFLFTGKTESAPVGANASVTTTIASSTTTTLSKSMITNASFRTKKLPGL